LFPEKYGTKAILLASKKLATSELDSIKLRVISALYRSPL
jgi:hypothetical protein